MPNSNSNGSSSSSGTQTLSFYGNGGFKPPSSSSKSQESVVIEAAKVYFKNRFDAGYMPLGNLNHSAQLERYLKILWNQMITRKGETAVFALLAHNRIRHLRETGHIKNIKFNDFPFHLINLGWKILAHTNIRDQGQIQGPARESTEPDIIKATMAINNLIEPETDDQNRKRKYGN